MVCIQHFSESKYSLLFIFHIIGQELGKLFKINLLPLENNQFVLK